MYPGQGTFVPINQNGFDRPARQQAELDQMMAEFLAWKKAEELEKYESAYARHLEQGGCLEDLDMFILAYPNLEA